MTRKRIMQQVHGILGMNGLKALSCDEDDAFLVRTVDEGSSASGRASSCVVIVFGELDGRTLITLRAELLGRFTPRAEIHPQLLERLNELNSATTFGRFYWLQREATVVLEYDLLGDELEEDELMVPLNRLGRVADRIDDELMREFDGGLRAMDEIAIALERS